MDIDHLTTELSNISSANEKLFELDDLRLKLISESKNWKELRGYLERCVEMQTELENERKGHAEELRQINQDINLLEDMVKSLQGTHKSKRDNLSKRVIEMQKEIRSVNEALRCCGDEESEQEFLDNVEELPPDLIQSVLLSKIPTTVPLTHALTTLFGSSRFPYGCIPNPSQPKPVQPEANKLKQCESCGGQIHRNAPTCPLCKCRTVSKNPKRNRKRENPQHRANI